MKKTWISNYKHDGKGTKLYHVWLDMKQRCSNINNKRYKNYGGRGIIVCPEWANCYITFRDWAIQNGYAEELQNKKWKIFDNTGN